MAGRVFMPTAPELRIRENTGPDFLAITRTLWKVGQAVLVFLLLGYLIWRGAAAMEYNWQWYRVEPFFYRIIDGEIIWGPLTRGLLQTMKLAGIAAIVAVLIGFVTAFARLSNSISGRVIATVYLEAIRNTPLLVQLFLFYFVLAPIFGMLGPPVAITNEGVLAVPPA